MDVKYNYLGEQYAHVEEYFADLRELVASGEFTLGPYVERFEAKFARYIGTKHVISTNNGTDALILALKAAKVVAGDEVITVPNSFYATVGAIAAIGARPVFVDSDDRYQIDVTKIAAAITKKTKAILPVSWGGCPPDLVAIMEIAKAHNLKVIEDACPAVGAKIGNKFAGTFGTLGTFSMHPLKPLNVWGDGGMIATDDDEIAKFLRIYRNHGMINRDEIVMWGVNARLQPVQAIVGSRQLDIMEDIIAKRRRNAQLLDEGLSRLSGNVTVPRRPKDTREVYQLYIASFKRRDELLRYLIEHKIEAKIHYPIPLHLQKPGRELGYKEGDFPVTEQQAKEIITLPSHQFLNDEHMAYTVDTIKAFYS